MDKSTESACRQEILDKLHQGGAKGLSTGALRIPNSGTKKGKLCRELLKKLLKSGEIGNLGNTRRPRYVLIEHFNPLEIACDALAARAKKNAKKLGSKNSLSQGIKGAAEKKIDEALKLLVAQGRLIRLSWSGNPVYLHVSNLPQPSNPLESATKTQPSTDIDEKAIQKAYRETVQEFGYADVMIHEIFLRHSGDLDTFKSALLQACETGQAIPNIGDWSLASEDERKAALYIGGRPHLRIRFKD